MTMIQSILGAVGWFALTFSAAFVASRFPADEWFEALAKPAWNPPNWLFGPVWALLYTLMAVSVWLVWRDQGFRRAALPLGLFILQLILNAAWSWIFFGRHEIGLAFVEIVLVGIAVLATTIAFWRLKPLSGALLLPYLAWVSFASVLNFTIWRLNS